MTPEPEDDDDIFDSPFAHVPAGDAGPRPMQDGFTTYEQMLSATGGVLATRPQWVRVVLGVMAAGALLVLLAVLLAPLVR